MHSTRTTKIRFAIFAAIALAVVLILLLSIIVPIAVSLTSTSDKNKALGYIEEDHDVREYQSRKRCPVTNSEALACGSVGAVLSCASPNVYLETF